MEALRIRLFCAGTLRKEPRQTLLLQTLASSGDLAPTHCGRTEVRLTDFSPAAVKEMLGTAGYGSVFVTRKEIPRWQGYLTEFPAAVSVIGIDATGKLSARRRNAYYDLATSLAAQLSVDFGFVHSIPETKTGGSAPAYATSGNIGAEQLQQFGPRSLYARTWLGPHLLQLIGAERLTRLPAVHRTTSWGAVELDLVENPWDADVAQLAAQQSAVVETLARSGIFGDYSSPNEPVAGPRWTGFPLVKQP
jgi:hypothetical protein